VYHLHLGGNFMSLGRVHLARRIRRAARVTIFANGVDAVHAEFGERAGRLTVVPAGSRGVLGFHGAIEGTLTELLKQ